MKTRLEKRIQIAEVITVFFFFALLFILLLYICVIGGGPMEEFWNNLWINIVCSIAAGLVTSVATTVFVYFKFLKRIPQETESKINTLLSDRLNYETSNHNAAMSALSPNNKHLSDEHNRIADKIDIMNNRILSDAAKAEVQVNNLTHAQLDIKGSVDAIAALEKQMEILQTENRQLSLENQNLRIELKHTQQQYTQSCNLGYQQDFGPSL